jgi:hypothetical protein
MLERELSFLLVSLKKKYDAWKMQESACETLMTQIISNEKSDQNTQQPKEKLGIVDIVNCFF